MIYKKLFILLFFLSPLKAGDGDISAFKEKVENFRAAESEEEKKIILEDFFSFFSSLKLISLKSISEFYCSSNYHSFSFVELKPLLGLEAIEIGRSHLLFKKKMMASETNKLKIEVLKDFVSLTLLAPVDSVNFSELLKGAIMFCILTQSKLVEGQNQEIFFIDSFFILRFLMEFYALKYLNKREIIKALLIHIKEIGNFLDFQGLILALGLKDPWIIELFINKKFSKDDKHFEKNLSNAKEVLKEALKKLSFESGSLEESVS